MSDEPSDRDHIEPDVDPAEPDVDPAEPDVDPAEPELGCPEPAAEPGPEPGAAEAEPPERGAEDHVQDDAEDFRTLLRSGDDEGLRQALDNPELVRLALDDERYLHIALQGISALAWLDPAEAGTLLKRYDPGRTREQSLSPASLAAQSIVAAVAWKEIEGRGKQTAIESFGLLRDFFRLRPALKDDTDFGAELRADLAKRPQEYAEFLASLPLHSGYLAEWIYHLSTPLPSEEEDEDAVDDSPLAQLEEEQLGALSSAMDELKGELARRWSRYLTWLAVAGVVLLFPGAAGILLGLLILGISMAMDEKRSYLSIVRPRLVTLAVEHGVGAQQVVSWLYRPKGKVGKVASFDVKIGNDAGLDLLAAISRALPAREG